MQSSFELTPKQAEYIRNANHRWNVACGAVRSGKSYCQISYCIPSRLVERKGLRGLRVILGATRSNIERNILQPMRDIYGDGIASQINSQNFCKILGEKVYCIGADNIRQVSRLKGSEIAYCAVDEATDVHKEVFEMLKSRLSLPWSCCDATTNPSGPNHWFKKFIDSAENGVDVYTQNFTLYDNPFLPEDYVRNLEAEYRGTVWFDRFILGKWTMAEGLVYPHFEDCLYDDPPAGEATEYCISIDYGTSNPFAALLWERHGRIWYNSHEYGYSGRDTGIQLTDNEYLDKLRACLLCYVPPKDRKFIRAYVDPSAASFITLLRKSGEFGVVGADNDVINGIRDVNTCIYRGFIKVNRNNRNTIGEFQSYRWDMDAPDGEDHVIKEYDHYMDALRYFVETRRVVPTESTGSYSSILGG